VNPSQKLVASLLAFCLLAGKAQAVTTPSQIQNELTEARISGQGTFRWFGLKIYEATLWVSKDGYRSASKFVLDLNYSRKLSGGRIAESSIDEIRKLGLGTPTQQATWLKQMRALFPDVKEGTHISGIYLPEQGARFYLDGELLGEILDAEFAQAFFAIWLDARSSAPKLRSLLLALPQ
jgi:hypothetical protein